MAEEYIKRNEAIKAFLLTDSGEKIPDFDIDNFPTMISYRAVRIRLREIPTEDVAPVRHGKWIVASEWLVCSLCGSRFDSGCDTPSEVDDYLDAGYAPNFCLNCGAVMDGDE